MSEYSFAISEFNARATIFEAKLTFSFDRNLNVRDSW